MMRVIGLDAGLFGVGGDDVLYVGFEMDVRGRERVGLDWVA